MKKVLFIALFMLLFTSRVFAQEPVVHYIFNEENLDSGMVTDLSGNGNNGKTNGEVRTDGEYAGETINGTVEIPVKPFLESDCYTWVGKFRSDSNLPPVLTISSSAGKIEVVGAGGSGIPRILSYRAEEYINQTSAMAYYGGGKYQDVFSNIALVHDEKGFVMYWNGERLEYNETEKCTATIKQILSGENPKIELYCDGICMTEFLMYNVALSADEVKEIAKLKASVSKTDGKISVSMPMDVATIYCNDASLYFVEYNDGKIQSVKKVAKDEFTNNKYGLFEVEYLLSDPENTVKCFVWKDKIEILN